MSAPCPPIQLQGLRFKGDRDYLHGSDILPVALRAAANGRLLNEISTIDIIFHSLARTGLTLCPTVPAPRERKAHLACIIDGVRRKWSLVEDGRPIVHRYPYPEEQIIAVTSINATSGTATSSDLLPFTSIERWVAMIKALHHAVYPNERRKWLFVRAKLASYRDSYPGMVEHSAKLQTAVADKLTRSTVMVNGRNVGDIFFALA